MNIFHALEVAASAISTNATRPATALMHDSPDTRVVMFRIEPGQQVAEHTSSSTVLLIVISGSGFVSGATGNSDVRAGDVVAYAAGEPHGMQANDETFVLAAVISPRPGAR